MNRFIITADTGSGYDSQKQVAESMAQLQKNLPNIQSGF